MLFRHGYAGRRENHVLINVGVLRFKTSEFFFLCIIEHLVGEHGDVASEHCRKLFARGNIPDSLSVINQLSSVNEKFLVRNPCKRRGGASAQLLVFSPLSDCRKCKLRNSVSLRKLAVRIILRQIQPLKGHRLFFVALISPYRRQPHFLSLLKV